MAKTILTALPLARNDISLIAGFFEESFDYYLNHNSAFFLDYRRQLRTLVGLGFAASLADSALLCIYQGYLNDFIKRKEGDFRDCSDYKSHIAQVCSEMVAIAIISFSALEFPRYYDDFLNALYYTMLKIPRLFGNAQEAERIFRSFLVSEV